MKKALSALIVALFCVLILVGCREKEKETAPDNAETNADHAHAFGIFLEHSSPTCTEPGSERAYCAYCEAYMEEMIAPLGHEMEGLRCEGRVCTRCGYEEAPGEHEFEEVLSLRPDCVSEGVIEHECGCGESYTETLPATGHEYGGWSIETEPTCTEKGSKKRSCTKCGHEETASVEAPGHRYKERITKAPSCEEEGVLLKECTRCEATEEEAIPAKGHEWEYKGTTKATCTEDGMEKYECTACGKARDEVIEEKLNHDFGDAPKCLEGVKCTRCGFTRKAMPHCFGERTTAPGCTTEGYTEEFCIFCGETFERVSETDALGHEFEEYISDNNATCTEDGTETAKCTRCDETDTRTVSGSAKGHDYGEWITVTHATCTEEGEEWRYCAACSNYESRALSPAGHVTKETRVEATCTEEGYITTDCTVCGVQLYQEILPKRGHTGGEATCTAKAVCEVCNESYGEPAAHETEEEIISPTCTEKGYILRSCKHCDFSERVSETDALGHEFEEYISDNNATCTEDGTETAKCTRCDETDTRTVSGSAKGHDYGEWITVTHATCTEDGEERRYCAACSNYESRALSPAGHVTKETRVEATCTEEGYIITQCTTCNEILSETTIPAKGHTGGEATCTARAVCEVCNEPYGEPAAHETEEEIISPTCTEKGYILRSCKHCDFSERVSETDALGHEFEEYISDNNATCTEDGTETAKCTRCDETDRRTVSGSAKGHDYGEWIITSPAGCTEEGVEEQSCSRCGLRKEKSIPAKGHNVETETKEATCTEEGYITTDCTVCGVQLYQEILPKLGHTGGEATCTAKAVCEVCNKPYGEYGAHKTILYDGAEATCTQPGCEPGLKCELCGLVIREPVQTEIKGHTIVSETTDPTCTEPGYTKEYCSVCGKEINKEEREPALGHSYGGYISNGNGSCASPGTETATCARCGATDTREAAVPGHKYEPVEEKEATCTEEGYRKYVCSVCKDESEETLPRTEHDYTCVTIYESPSACKCGRVITNEGNVEMDNNAVVGIPKNTSIIVVPWTANKIKEGIFRGNEDIETIYFGKYITSLEVWMFEGCTNLKTIYVPEGCKINEPLGLPDSAEIIFVDYSD